MSISSEKIITIVRERYTASYTEGELLYCGRRFCYTLEDACRSDGKIYGETAIPAGIYTLDINMSPKFKRTMIQILDVPNYSGVRIHNGNTNKDTYGCPLVAFNRIGKGVIQKGAEKELLSLVKEKQITHIHILDTGHYIV